MTIIGIGNEWRSDDAAGLEVVRRLRRLGRPDMKLIEMHGEPAGLLDRWEGDQSVVLVDAVHSGAPPGTIHRFDARSAPVRGDLHRASSHHLSVAEAIELGRVLGRLPRSLELIGIEAAGFEAGRGLAAPVDRAVDRVVAELA